MPRMTAPVWYGLIVIILVLGSVFVWAKRVPPAGADAEVLVRRTPARETAVAAPITDHPAPDFALTSIAGSEVQLSQLAGQVVLINVWATWCPPCRAEMPAIQAAYEQYRDQGFTVLAVNQQEDARTVAAYLRDEGLTFTALLDEDGSVSTAYQARVLPSSFFVDRRGVIRAVYRGPMPRSVIAGTVVQLLQEAP